jgi:hypothetical protein
MRQHYLCGGYSDSRDKSIGLIFDDIEK